MALDRRRVLPPRPVEVMVVELSAFSLMDGAGRCINRHQDSHGTPSLPCRTRDAWRRKRGGRFEARAPNAGHSAREPGELHWT